MVHTDPETVSALYSAHWPTSVLCCLDAGLSGDLRRGLGCMSQSDDVSDPSGRSRFGYFAARISRRCNINHTHPPRLDRVLAQYTVSLVACGFFIANINERV